VRTRLREAHSPEELARLYAVPHRHDRWPDHRLRVAETIGVGRELGVPSVIADLSCGDAVIPRALAAAPRGASRVILGDIAPGYEMHGPIEITLSQITHVGLFICAETAEHLDDPDAVLARIRDKADALLLSTPLGETGGRNPEHYWGWDEAGARKMLEDAGWRPEIYRDVAYRPDPAEPWDPADYQIWGCR
jgi:hypothetical protein